jgi:two-component system, OmpR family, sensor histidine kinase VicK
LIELLPEPISTAPSPLNANSQSTTTRLIEGIDNVLNAELQFFSNARKRIDTCMNYTRPELAIMIEQINKAFLHAKGRSVVLRYITEITKDNISYCKQLMTIVDELRHLEGIKGNFMLSETEYIAPIILFEKGKIASQIIYSNQKEIVDQHQYIFDTLWNKAVSAEQRIKEIEDGIIGQEHYQTRFLENPNDVSEELKKTINTSEDDSWSTCSTFDGLLMLTYNKDFEKMQGRLLDSTRRGKNTRWVGSINNDNIYLVKAYLDLGMKIKHINHMPPMNFAVSSKELYATIDEMKGGQIARNLLVSNEPHYVKHFKSIFEELWNNGIDAIERIRDIEAGVDLADVQVIANSLRAQDRYIEIVKSASKEILWIFPTTNAFLRQDKMGAIPLAMQAARERNVKVKILVPANKLIEEKVQQLKQNCHSCQIDVRYKEQMSETMATILVVDRKDSMVMELKDDSKSRFAEAIGLSTYSNSKAGVLSYVSIFENLWKQSELYEQLMKAHEQLKMHDRMQKEFIDVAAHELRTPIQPILGLTQMIYSKIDEDEYPYTRKQQKELLEAVIRNANRLQRLTEDILDVTRIESQNLSLNLERINLDEMILNAINDTKRNQQIKKNVILLYQQLDEGINYTIQADKGRLNQVMSNLISNAIKFTEEGSIIITSKKEENENKVIVSVKDRGIGIHPEILPRLFQKFATKSFQGTGLGLYISKSILEAHGGKMWAENNPDGKGATFSFSLPIVNR